MCFMIYETCIFPILSMIFVNDMWGEDIVLSQGLHMKYYDKAKVNKVTMWYMTLYFETESTEMWGFSWTWTAGKMLWLEEGDL